MFDSALSALVRACISRDRLQISFLIFSESKQIK